MVSTQFKVGAGRIRFSREKLTSESKEMENIPE